MAEAIYRVQDREGRGPWRPGFSGSWSVGDLAQALPTAWEEVPDLAARIAAAKARGLAHVGCAVRGAAGLREWFSRADLVRLRDLGFAVVCSDGCEVLAETRHQVVIVSRAEMRGLPRLRWRLVWTLRRETT